MVLNSVATTALNSVDLMDVMTAGTWDVHWAEWRACLRAGRMVCRWAEQKVVDWGSTRAALMVSHWAEKRVSWKADRRAVHWAVC
jgi:hypothetical protein